MVSNLSLSYSPSQFLNPSLNGITYLNCGAWHDCNIKCDVEDGCKNLWVSINHESSATPSKNVVWICQGDGACQDVTVYGRIYGDITVNCLGNNACYNIRAYVTLMNEGSRADVKCRGNSGCSYSTWVFTGGGVSNPVIFDGMGGSNWIPKGTVFVDCDDVNSTLTCHQIAINGLTVAGLDVRLHFLSLSFSFCALSKTKRCLRRFVAEELKVVITGE